MGHVWAVEGNEAMKIIYSFLKYNPAGKQW